MKNAAPSKAAALSKISMATPKIAHAGLSRNGRVVPAAG
jgi:hypothetical protein